MTDKNTDQFDQLREPFPAKAVGHMPKGGTQLAYVGHAAVTDRLLTVDPWWYWEPLAMDADGLPLIRQVGKDAVLWIRLSCAGMTRLGVGTAPANGFELHKQLISDAIRNAAMRFGVALDLWSKDELESQIAADDAPPADLPSGPAHPPMAARDHRRRESLVLLSQTAAGFEQWQKDLMAAERDRLGWPTRLEDYSHEQATEAVAAALKIADTQEVPSSESPQGVESMTQEGTKAHEQEQEDTGKSVPVASDDNHHGSGGGADVSPPRPDVDGAFTVTAVRGITHAQITKTAKSLKLDVPPSGSVLVRMDALAAATDLEPADLMGLVRTINAKENA